MLRRNWLGARKVRKCEQRVRKRRIVSVVVSWTLDSALITRSRGTSTEISKCGFEKACLKISSYNFKILFFGVSHFLICSIFCHFSIIAIFQFFEITVHNQTQACNTESHGKDFVDNESQTSFFQVPDFSKF